jgi:hypothetical protein
MTDVAMQGAGPVDAERPAPVQTDPAPYRGVPVLGVALLCVAAAIAGGAVGAWMKRPPTRIAVAEKGGVVLQALLEHPGLTSSQAQRQIATPILRVLAKYADAGYMVVDAGRDRAGQLVVDAVPPDAIDITPELRRAAGLPPAAPSAPGRANGVQP